MNNYLDTMVSTIIPIFLIYRLELNYKCEKRPARQEQWGVKKNSCSVHVAIKPSVKRMLKINAVDIRLFHSPNLQDLIYFR